MILISASSSLSSPSRSVWLIKHSNSISIVYTYRWVMGWLIHIYIPIFHFKCSISTFFKRIYLQPISLSLFNIKLLCWLDFYIPLIWSLIELEQSKKEVLFSWKCTTASTGVPFSRVKPQRIISKSNTMSIYFVLRGGNMREHRKNVTSKPPEK